MKRSKSNLWAVIFASAMAASSFAAETKEAIVAETEKVLHALHELQDYAHHLIQIKPEQLQAQLKIYREAKIPADRFAAAANLSLDRYFLGNPENSSIQLSDGDRQTLERAYGETAAARDKAEKFESELTQAEIEKVTSSNPLSFYRFLGKFFLSRSQETCDFEAYRNLRRTVSFRELAYGGRNAGALIDGLEMSFRQDYVKKLVELLKSDKRFAAYRSLADDYYAVDLTKLSKLPNIEDLKKDAERRVKSITKDWVANGVAASEVRTIAYGLGAKSPECLEPVSKTA